MEVVQDFESSYAVDSTPDWPNAGEDVLSFTAYDKLNMHSGEFHDIRFYPAEGPSWIGRFEKRGSANYLDAVFTTPEKTCAMVISSGAGFWVNVETKETHQLESLPITGARTSVNNGLILVATWRELIAFCDRHVKWSLRSVIDDRLKIVELNPNIVTIVGFDGGMVKLSVDICTGKVLEMLRID